MEKRTQISVSLRPELLAALEKWREAQPVEVSRARAVEALLALALKDQE